MDGMVVFLYIIHNMGAFRVFLFSQELLQVKLKL